MPIEPFIHKLHNFAALSQEEERQLRNCVDHTVAFGAHDDIIQRGEKPEYVHLLLEGWAGRYRDLSDGNRQIMAFLIPGDICDLHVALLDQMDHSIGALSACRVGFIRDATLTTLIDRHKNLATAFWMSSLVDEAISREWLVSMGRRSAEDRLGHFLCEILFRTRGARLTDDDHFDLPLTQEQLSDAMGMSLVHMNRSLQKLRNSGLITFSNHKVTIRNLPALMKTGEFDPLYLHQQNKICACPDEEVTVHRA